MCQIICVGEMTGEIDDIRIGFQCLTFESDVAFTDCQITHDPTAYFESDRVQYHFC